MTGIDNNGKIICSCPLNPATFDITASASGGFQFWPSGVPKTYTDPNNNACTITVTTPNATDSAIIDGSNPGRTGWTFDGSTGYPAGTSFTLHVNVPNCTAAAAIGSVGGDNYPLCSVALDNGSSESTDEATVTPSG
jgi:hypothetical protein